MIINKWEDIGVDKKKKEKGKKGFWKRVGGKTVIVVGCVLVAVAFVGTGFIYFSSYSNLNDIVNCWIGISAGGIGNLR